MARMPRRAEGWGEGLAADLGGQGETGEDVFDIDREHPEYTVRKAVWRQYRDLYVGGEQLKINAQNYLIRRQREPVGQSTSFS